ncbi:YfhO family protein [Butyrivibrio sp. INlla14]|uniref:YfhO family protein n=1 Tax=Butyrivibrio sp. INlla14 TaxID=1520808 RepID=UPI000876805F|nr:YfhO family protein [Butyrivibrio sp. INlla14]SCX83301.1 membrane protein YfhO [Butyrivibrio sp. INlla14]
MSETSISRKNKENKVYAPVIMFASAFLMYVLAALPIFIGRGLPFFYYGDYNVQQIPFYLAAHRAVENGEFFWNWNIDLGGSMAGDFSFYLWGSPFFWVTMLFPENYIPYLMPFLMALKYATAACCAYLYIRRYVHKYSYAMIGGYLFAFSGFNACNIVFNHFTDSVAFFPLFLLTFEKLMAQDDENAADCDKDPFSFIYFACMTAFMSVVNYYFFFGQVVFLIIYYIVRYGRNNGVKANLRMFNKALFGGITGVLLAGFFLMQAYAGIKGNTRLDNYINGYNMLIYPSEKLLWDIVKSVSMLPDIIGKGTLFYTGTVKNASLAAYIPMFGISGVVAYFLLNKKKKNWEKTMLIICGVIAFLPVFNAAFSMFNSSYYARWYYMPILLMCLMTAQVTERGKSPQLKKGAIVAVIMFLFFLLVYLLPSKNDDGEMVFFNMTENNTIFLRDVLGTAILCLMLLAVVFALPRNFKGKLAGKNENGHYKTGLRDGIILFAVIISCIISTFVPLKNGSGIISNRGKEKWQEQMLFNKVNVDQSKFCRGEVDSTSTNYDMAWGIPSIHCFLSTVPSEIFDFLYGSCGITRTVETNLPVDRCGARAILSGRYYFENADISKNRVFHEGEGTDGYFFLKNENGFDVFDNLNFIPMGFTFDYYITQSEWEDLEAKEHDYDLARVLIISDEDALKLGDSIAMKEMTAEDILNNEMSYLEFSDECKKRAATSCSEFTTDTRGFTATTAMLKDSTLVFFSVPFTEGFSCMVDGQETEMIKADYGLMAVPVSGGVHEIRVTYEPEGFTQGLVMSIAGIFILGICFVYTLKKVNKND